MNSYASFDRLGRGVDHESYTYDSNGNRTNAGYMTGDHNRLLSDGTCTYEYDAEGNRTRRTHIGTGAVTEYVWDNRNRLVEVIDRTAADGPALQTVQYVYDTQNRWIAKTLDPDGDGPEEATHTHFVYDGGSVLSEPSGGPTASESEVILQLDDDGEVTNRYLWGPAVDQILADEQMTNTAGDADLVWMLTDHLNTVRDLAQYDRETGQTAVVNHLTYDAFGQRLAQTNPTWETLFAFTARPLDPDTGLQNNLNRWYDASEGRWLSQDMIGFEAADSNLYRYVANQTTTTLDPSGMGFWSNYWHYLTHPSKLDHDLYIANNVAYGMIGVGAGGLAGVGVATGVGAVGAATGAGCAATSTAGSLAGGLVGSKVGGAVGGIAGDLGKQIGETGGGIAGSMTGAKASPVCFVAGTPVLVPEGSHVERAMMSSLVGVLERFNWNSIFAGGAILVGLAGWYADEADTRRKRRRREGPLSLLLDEPEEQIAAQDDSEPAASTVGQTWDAEETCTERRKEDAAGDQCTCTSLFEESRKSSGGEHTTENDAERLPAMASVSAHFSPAYSWARRGAWWLAVCLLIAGLFTGKAIWGTSVRSAAHFNVPAVHANLPASQPIETIGVGQRVVTPMCQSSPAGAGSETQVDPSTWRLLRLRAEDRWADGTLDVINVETLQPPEWIAQHGAKVGATVSLPLDLVEMGLPESMKAQVTADEPCPALAPGPGRVVLTTVNHLNSYVWELTLCGQNGREETIRPTGFHKFFSASRKAWISAKDLKPGEEIPGVQGIIRVASITRYPGAHRVYNMTVEGEHVFRVSRLGALVHNNGCHVGNLDPGVGVDPVGPEITPERAVDEIVNNGEDIIAANQTQARQIAQGASEGGRNPVLHTPSEQPPHYHPVGPDGTKLPSHVWWW